MKLSAFFLAGLGSLPVCSFADYVCPGDSDTCQYLINTGETAAVGVGGGGKTADKSEWVSAPQGKYLANGETKIASQNGRSPICAIVETAGSQSRRVAGIDVKVYSKYRVQAHSETGSGAQAIGRTAHMQCQLTAQVVDLPN